VGDIPWIAGQQVIHADNLIAVAQEPLAQMRPDESRSSGYDRYQREFS
jgi:hypothetical protein